MSSRPNTRRAPGLVAPARTAPGTALALLAALAPAAAWAGSLPIDVRSPGPPDPDAVAVRLQSPVAGLTAVQRDGRPSLSAPSPPASPGRQSPDSAPLLIPAEPPREHPRRIFVSVLTLARVFAVLPHSGPWGAGLAGLVQLETGSRFGVEAYLAAEGQTPQSVPPGTLFASLWTAGVSARWLLGRHRASRVELVAGPAFHLLDVSSRGFAQHLDALIPNASLLLAARVRQRLHSGLFLAGGLELEFFARREILEIRNAPRSLDLSVARGRVGVGLGWDFN